MEKAIQHLSVLEGLDLTDFYAINLWKHESEVSLQGYFTDRNMDIVKTFGIKLELDGSLLRGTTTTEFGKLRIVLTTKS